MFQTIMTPENRLIFTETHLNRDGDDMCTFIIGYGYGIFGSLTQSEIVADRDNKYKAATIVVGYQAVNSPDIVIGDEVFQQQATEPDIDKARLKYRCSWRGKTYAISGVSKKYSVNGKFVGYRVYSENN